MLRQARQVASEKMLKIEIFQQYVMIFRRFDHESFDLKQREKIIFWRIENERRIIYIVNANYFPVFNYFFDDHFEKDKIDREIFNFLVFCVDLIVNVKTYFRVLFEFIKQMKVVLIKT